ncbi:hypothetical protein GALMADRAFT_254862 [Galerina marginata CBS 339.88]|uniref:DUF6534 domain-containing protein n=1 Tax=Galerina marginata (strain CBS 339.88) TaxID=685588 RepID=A0A067SUI7_GALM3|nr:hypothetical protein GALMADRAFT_254862 [Galerina marginata CBS 339.88]
MVLSVGSTLGAAFLGTLAAAVLFGVTIVQTYIYYVHYPNDWRFQKIFVGILLVLDAVHLAITTHAIYAYTILDFGNLAKLTHVIWSFKLETALNVLIITIVQSLYALRVWKLGRHFSRWWPIVTVAVVLGGYAVGLLLAIKTYHITKFIELEGIAWAVEASFATSTAIDVVLSASMCYYLYKSRTTFTETNNRIITIMNYVVVSGTLTSACSLSALITYVTMPNNFIFLGISFLLTKLYISSYMAMLNARKVTRNEDSSSFAVNTLKKLRRLKGKPVDIGTASHKVEEDSFQLSAIGYRSKPSDTEEGFNDSVIHQDRSAVIGIKVHRTEERLYDDDSKRYSSATQ